MPDNVEDMIKAASEKNPTAFKSAFEKAVAATTGEALIAKRMEIGTKVYPGSPRENGE
jgi:hypothetical protein